MEIVGRIDEPWDALFIFHFLSSDGDQMVAEKLQKLVTRETSIGLNFGKQVIAGKSDASCRISGRFLERKECLALLALWNEPDGEMDWMCYTPNHGIATVRDGKIDWWALICFQCANAGIAGKLATAKASAPNRNLPNGAVFNDQLINLLPERPFPIQM